MRLALYQPDIPQNTGTILRLGACMGVGVDIIEPCGFILDDRRIRRAGMDYIDHVEWRRHSSWEAFRRARAEAGRLVLLTTKGSIPHTSFTFAADDILVFGRESAGVPDAVAAECDARIRIPLAAGLRSLNVAVSAALALGEALRQTNSFPQETPQ